MDQSLQDNDLDDARTYLGCTRLTVDRCRHESITETSLWIFDGATQIASVTRVSDYPGAAWRVSHMHRGMPVAQTHTRTLLDALGWILRRDKDSQR